MSSAKLANEAWEALLRAQVTLSRAFTAEDMWDELSPTEYDVLYTLSKADGGLRSADINRRVLLTQAGVSRLVARLKQRGLVERHPDPDDHRASRIVLTPAGQAARRRVGERHARSVTDAMTSALDEEGLTRLKELCHQLTFTIAPDLHAPNTQGAPA